MAECYGAAIHVDLVPVEAEFLLDREVLAGKGLVDLDEIDVRQIQSGVGQSLTRCGGCLLYTSPSPRD